MRLAVNTQTPLIRFVEGEPRQTTGGVVRMLVPLLQRWQDEGIVRAAEWVAMASGEEDHQMRHAGLELSFVGVPDDEKRSYAVAKEKMWELLNSNPSTLAPHGADGVPEDAWIAYDRYQERSARALEEAAQRMGGVDLLYVHDFQQLGVARAWRGPAAPKVFHLHTPFPSVMPSGWADHLVAQMRHYDGVIVSTKRYAENLRAAGYDRPIHVIHPFIDPASYPRPSPQDAAAFRTRFEIEETDRVILNVGRMDPMKGQDRLLRAMPAVLAREPRARLVLVGNGSFSSSKRGGLGLDKGKAWRASCEALAAELGVAHRVTFTGHLDEASLPAAYEACEVFSLPSTREGFGLAAIEAWRQRKPVVVCDRAGVSELVEDHVNGFVVDAADPSLLARSLLEVLRDPDAARAMGREGLITSEAATLETGRRALERVFAGVAVEDRYALA